MKRNLRFFYAALLTATGLILLLSRRPSAPPETEEQASVPDLYLDPSLPPSANFLPPLQTRTQLGHLLEALGFTGNGAEIGVDRGQFSEILLSTWPSCKRLYLVDPWPDNFGSRTGSERYQEAMERLEPFKHKIDVIREDAQTAAERIEDDFLDFIYIDALHDYCSVWNDINSWWKKLRQGGIMAGHDYMSMNDLERNPPNLKAKVLGVKWHLLGNWHLCANGTVNEGSVKAAVQKFAQTVDRALVVTYANEPYGGFKIGSWMIRK